jgi:hypothetical protein
VRLAVRNRHRRSLCGKSPAQSEQWYCWIGRRRIISVLAGIIFTLVALFHLVRIYMEWPVMESAHSAGDGPGRSGPARSEHRRLGPS